MKLSLAGNVIKRQKNKRKMAENGRKMAEKKGVIKSGMKRHFLYATTRNSHENFRKRETNSRRKETKMALLKR
jgi:hypothetical protein